MKYVKKVRLFISSLCLSLLCTVQASALNINLDDKPSLGNPISDSDFIIFFGKYKAFCTFILGLCTISALIAFIIAITKFSTSAGNENERLKAIKGLLFSGIALALFGGATTIVAVFWNIFN